MSYRPSTEEEPATISTAGIVIIIAMAILAIPIIFTLTTLGLNFANHIATGWEEQRKTEVDNRHLSERRERVEIRERCFKALPSGADPSLCLR